MTTSGSGSGAVPEILFVNQSAGQLFRELAEDLALTAGSASMLTGHVEGARMAVRPPLCLRLGPAYRRTSDWSRVWSWIRFFTSAAREAWSASPRTLLFLVSNPPMLPLLGWLLKRLRGQRYVVLVYDIHPELLVAFGRLRSSHPMVRAWQFANRVAWENADAVFTIGAAMGQKLESLFDASRTSAGGVVVIPNWSDPAAIRPVHKSENEFARAHGQQDKLTVLYAGNLGETQDLSTLVETARRLRDDASIHFMMIGDGSRRGWVEEQIRLGQLRNVTLLPRQPEELLSNVLAMGDIAVVSLARGAESYSVPSKLYSSMAAGSALLLVMDARSDGALMVSELECGAVVEPGDVDGMIAAIKRFASSPSFLAACRARSREALVNRFARSRATSAYADTLRRLGFLASSHADAPQTAP